MKILSNYKAIVIGDLHISDRYSGKHTDYYKNCVDVLMMLTEEIERGGYTHIFLLGDLVGMTDKNMKTREGLLYFMRVLQHWRDVVKGNLFSVIGNHDIGGKLTDFEMFTTLDLIKTPSYVDMGCLRMHLINYGDEHRDIERNTAYQNGYDIALMHNNLQVEGRTTWFRAGEGIELSSLYNLKGVDVVVSGHIHNTSPAMVQTSIGESQVTLFYPGCPTRPKWDKNIWETTYGVVIEVDNQANSVGLDLREFKLKPSSEIFKNSLDDADLTEIPEDTQVDIGMLTEILEELSNYNISNGVIDYKGKIKQLAGIDNEAAELAIEYVEKVELDFK